MTGATLTWTFGNGQTFIGDSPVTTTFDEPGIYNVSLAITSGIGCSGDTTYNDYIEAYANPIANFYSNPGLPTVSNQDIEFVNTSENADSYAWNFSNQESSLEINPTYNFNTRTEQTYEICLTAISEKGCPDVICQNVTIYEELLFYIPNVFTPDGDDYNEIFKPIFTSGYDPYDYHLIIFNRWGETVFESFNADYGWNGFYTNNKVQDGMYVWQVEFGTETTDQRELYRGHVMLLK
jgi:gliding motility-associated-like protein